jgi:hypothetical protein
MAASSAWAPATTAINNKSTRNFLLMSSNIEQSGVNFQVCTACPPENNCQSDPGKPCHPGHTSLDKTAMMPET